MGAPRVARATAPDPREEKGDAPSEARRPSAARQRIAVATSRSSNDGARSQGQSAVPPQPTNMLQIFSLVGAQGDRGPGGRRSSSPYGPVRLVVAPTPDL